MLRKLFYFLGACWALLAATALLARFVPPDVFWPPSILSLLLPGLLCGVLLYAAICLFRREWRHLVLPTLVLLAATPLAPRLLGLYLGRSTVSSGEPVETATLITNNVRHFKDDNSWGIDPQEGLAYVRAAKPDAVFFQEFYRFRDNSHPLVATAKQAVGINRRHQPTEKSVATFAEGAEFVADYFSPENKVNGILVTDVPTAIGKLRLINAHLYSNQITTLVSQIGEQEGLEGEVGQAKSMLRRYANAAAARAKQADMIRKVVEQSPYPVIVGGDFNDVPSSYTYRRILTPRLRDAWAEHGGLGLGTTYTGPLPGLRIDYFMVDTALQVQSIERIKSSFSDHAALKLVVTK